MQTKDILTPGTRVELKLANGDRHSGRVVVVDTVSMTVLDVDRVYVFSWAGIGSVETRDEPAIRAAEAAVPR